jgi:hypothetical protein
MEQWVRNSFLAVGLLALVVGLCLGFPAEINATAESVFYDTGANPVKVNGVTYSPQIDQQKFNEKMASLKYFIVDLDHQVYGFESKEEYIQAEKAFQQKWSKQVVAMGKNATDLYQHANYKGWWYGVAVGYAVNFNNSKYNDNVSSLKTASNSSGTRVCFHKNGGEPCKTYAPGLNVSYVGDGWNDQISYVAVYER